MREPRIIIAKTHHDIAQVKTIFLEYLDFIEDFLGAPLDFQNTQKEFKIFPKTYETLDRPADCRLLFRRLFRRL